MFSEAHISTEKTLAASAQARPHSALPPARPRRRPPPLAPRQRVSLRAAAPRPPRGRARCSQQPHSRPPARPRSPRVGVPPCGLRRLGPRAAAPPAASPRPAPLTGYGQPQSRPAAPIRRTITPRA
ncbi:hypothetical protein ABZP36_031059 [Zizania latifolia]